MGRYLLTRTIGRYKVLVEIQAHNYFVIPVTCYAHRIKVWSTRAGIHFVPGTETLTGIIEKCFLLKNLVYSLWTEQTPFQDSKCFVPLINSNLEFPLLETAQT